MMDKRFLDAFLRLNKIDAGASASEIKGVLSQARWPQEQIEEALLLRAGVAALASQSGTRVFRPDMDWSSSKLSTLLGTDVVVDPKTFRVSASKAERLKNGKRKVLVWIALVMTATAVAASIGYTLLYVFEVGPFHTVTAEII